MKNKIKIPVALQICFDDLAWHDGRDLRWKGQASRSGIPRDHAIEDYLVIHELGKALNQKILAPLCLGDWDKDNILRGEVGITHDPSGWDRASKIDMEYAGKCFNALEGSEYIEYAVHSTMHGKYAEDGSLIHENEYFDTDENGKRHPISIEDFERRLKLFYAIYNSWGFKKPIKVIGSPGGVSGSVDKEELHALGKSLKKYGIKYWHARWANGREIEDLIGDVRFAPISNNLKPAWNAYDVDPNYLPDAFDPEEASPYGLISLHWTNFIRFYPEKNFEYLPRWIAYFNRQAEKLGCMLSRDFKFSVDQQVYHDLVKPEFAGDRVVFKLGKLLSAGIEDLPREFCVSFVKDTLPKEISGGSLSLYEEHENFNTYKITYSDKIYEITVKI